jgi:hypothetical protein
LAEQPGIALTRFHARHPFALGLAGKDRYRVGPGSRFFPGPDEPIMKPIGLILIMLFLTGCSTAPVADLMDRFYPGQIGPEATPPYGGVSTPYPGGLVPPPGPGLAGPVPPPTPPSVNPLSPAPLAGNTPPPFSPSVGAPVPLSPSAPLPTTPPPEPTPSPPLASPGAPGQ